MTILARIERLFDERGSTVPNARRGAVTPLQHALQCARLAEWAGLAEPLVAAALLHDIGHLLPGHAGVPGAGGEPDGHDERGAAFLAEAFCEAVVEPVRLHVQAKRYLVTVDPGYRAALCPASLRSLARQGGPMDERALRAFEALPHALDALALRRLDDVSHQPARRTPALAHYKPLLERLHRRTVHSAAH